MKAFLLLLLLAQPPENMTPPADASLDSAVETSHFSFQSRAALRGAASGLAATADALRARVLRDLGTAGPDHTRVLLATDLEEMQRLAPRGVRVPSWAVGMAFTEDNLMLLRLNSGAAPVDVPQTFLHEWAHLAFDQAVGKHRVPRWFREGFAIYESGEWSFGRSAVLTRGVFSGRLFSLEALTESFPAAVEDAELAYAQSIDFVGFLLKKYGPASFHRLIALLGGTYTFLAAVEEAYDDSIRHIEDAWHSDLKVRFTWIPLLTGAASFWTLATFVFVLAYLKRRRSRKAAMARMPDDDFPEPPELDPPPDEPPPGGWMN